jgi:hypothetical protein
VRELSSSVSLLFPDLLKDADGVYQPLPPAWLQFSLLGGGLLAGGLMTYSKGGPWMSFAVPVGLAIGFGVRSALALRRWGLRGQPLVRIAGGALTIRGGDKSGRDFEMPLVQVAHLVIYGPTGHRTYRFVQPDGSWREARPQWRPKAEALVLTFLQEALREQVVVEEPQTAFAQARGDGPYFGS